MRVTDGAVDAVGHQLVVLADFERNRPVRAEVDVRAVKEPETDNEAYNTGQERHEAKGIVSHRKDR